MPHYADGTEAKVGDHVFGKLYNTEGVRAGTIISITPGAESCNALVGFLVALLGAETLPPAPRMTVIGSNGTQLVRIIRGEQHGSSGPAFALYECADYCATNELTKVD